MSIMRQAMCAVFGHQYALERALGYGARKVCCTRCGKHWAMHDDTRSFLPWDEDFELLYAPGGLLADPHAREVEVDQESNAVVAGRVHIGLGIERGEK